MSSDTSERLYGKSNPDSDLNAYLTKISRVYLNDIGHENKGKSGIDAIETAATMYRIRAIGNPLQDLTNDYINTYVGAAKKHKNNPNKLHFLNQARQQAITRATHEYNAMILYKREKDKIDSEYAKRIGERLPPVPSSKKGGRKHTRNKKRRSKTSKKRKNKRKTKRNKRNTKKNKKIIGAGTCSSSEAKCIDNIPTAKAQELNSATRTSFKHGLIPWANAETPRVAAYNVSVYKEDKKIKKH